MNEELKKILDESTADQHTKERAVKLSLEIAVPIAFQMSGMSAGGEFLKLLIELVKELLPILLMLLKPTTPS